MNNILKIKSHEKKRLSILKSVNKAESLFTRSPLANLIILACCGADGATIYTVLNYSLSSHPITHCLALLGFVIALDISMGVAGNCIKQAKEKLRSRKETTVIVTICICCFLISFGLFSSMRISTRAMLKESSNLEETTQTAAGETEEPASKTEGPASETEEVDESDNSSNLVTAIALALLPIATSFISLVVSLVVSTPIQDKLYDLSKARIKLQSLITAVDEVLAETEDADEYTKKMTAMDDELYQSFLAEIDKSSTTLKLKVRTLLMEKLDNPDQITSLTESSKAVLTSNDNSADTTESPKIHTTSNHFIA